MFVEIIRFAGVKDKVHVFLEQIGDMAVSKLGGVTNRVGRNGMLSFNVKGARGNGAQNRLHIQCREEGTPEKDLFVV